MFVFDLCCYNLLYLTGGSSRCLNLIYSTRGFHEGSLCYIHFDQFVFQFYRYRDTVGVAIHDAMMPWDSRFMMP